MEACGLMPVKLPRLIGNRSLFFPASKKTKDRKVPYKFFNGILGVPLKKRFESKGIIEIFGDPSKEGVPDVKSWIGKAKAELMRRKNTDERDFLMRFMDRVREALWVAPSEYQNRIMQDIIIEGELNAEW